MSPPENEQPVVAVDWEGPCHHVGDVVDDEIVAGYEFSWEKPEDSIETVATVRTYRIRNSYSTYRVDYRSDRVATTVP